MIEEISNKEANITLAQQMEHLKNVLKKEREARGWSQNKLAVVLNTSPNIISLMESEKQTHTPHLVTLVKMSKLFNMTICEMLGVNQPT